MQTNDPTDDGTPRPAPRPGGAGPRPGDLRENGRQQVLGVIRKARAIARIDIAEKSGVSPATVTAITSELLAEGLIEERAPGDLLPAIAEPGDSKRGRPRVALKIRGAAHLVAGLKVSGRSATVSFLDFEGHGIGEYETPLPKPQLSAMEMAKFIRDTLIKSCNDNGLEMSSLSGIGIGVAGIVDAPRGLVYWSPTLSERNVRLRAILEKMLPAPVFIDNDANLVTKAEQLFGEGRDVNDFIVVTIEHGVGMGVVINDKIYRGARGCGAEFGHTKVQLDGALCRCGQRGCLEAYVADYALLREADVTASRFQNTDHPENPDPVARLNRLFLAAKAGDQTAQSIFHRAGRMFSLGLANIINIFDPKLIILSGERMQFDYLYADAVLDGMKSLVVQVDAPLPEVRIHKWGDLMWAKGAAAYAMEGVTDLAIRRMSDNAG